MRRCICLLSLILLATTATATEWPHPRGPHQDGRLPSIPGLPDHHMDLELRWKAPLGSGYSGVALSGGTAVTMFSDGAKDHVVALDATSGRELWRYTVGTTYKGHDGSHDGPLSTPVIDDDVVFGLGPFGQLFALSMEDGSEIWTLSLEKDLGAVAPEYGYTATPLVEGKVLVVLTGAEEGGAVVGLDKSSGRRLWSAGQGQVEYHSPISMQLEGRRQVVAVSGKKIQGIDPGPGKVLWEHDLGEGASTYAALVTPLDENRLFVGIGGESVMLKVSGGRAEELFRTTELGNSYGAPVYHDGHLYGFKRQFLTCVNAASGEKVWKSRPPGGRGLILLGERLVIFGAQGHLVVADATPEGYRERSRRKVLDRSGYTWPSFADGRVLLRNLDEIVGVSIVEASKIAGGEIPMQDRAPRNAFERWVRKVQASAEKKALVAAFLEEHEQFPVVDGDFVHFLYVGDADDVAIEGSMIDSETAEPLIRIEGTDLFFRSYEVGKSARVDYRFQVDFGDAITDPRNPRKVPARWDDTGYSEVSLSGEAPPDYLGQASGNRGRLETLQLTSEILGDERELSVYLPAGYGEGDTRYPLLLVAEGREWTEKGLLINALDNLLARGATPVVAVLIPRSREWWREGGGVDSQAFARMLAEELVPRVEESYRAGGSPERRALMGVSGYASSLAYAVLQHGDVFGKAALQSLTLEDALRDAIFRALESARSRPAIYLAWNRYENRNREQGSDARRDTMRLADALKKHGHRYDGGEQEDSYGWGGWRSRTDEILASLFPPRTAGR